MKKRKWIVDIYRGQECEDERNNFKQYCCTLETFAVSKEKAINNARFRFAGLYSQHLPYEVSCHWSAWVWYEAREADKEEQIELKPKQEQKEFQPELFSWRYQQ